MAFINSISASSLGPIQSLSANKLQNINLLIGGNGAGKTFLLKALYASLKTIEQYKRGQEVRSDKEILANKLYWTFQSPLGNLVRKGDNTLSFKICANKNECLEFYFGSSTTKQVQNLQNSFNKREEDNTIFIPAKEILSLRTIITDSRNRYSEFGFDDPYLDLANALSPTYKGKNYKAFSEARASLESTIGGKLEYDVEKKQWQFRDTNKRVYEVNITSEGIKKLSILELLLGNHYLSANSVIIIDEIEANLHPSMIDKFLKVIVTLAKSGIQFFISTHSYFVIKNLYILAHTEDIHIPTLSFESDGIKQSDLHEEMPDNPIIRESINLYKREIDL